MSLGQFIRFTNDASAIEKTLRLLQGCAQILAAYAASSQLTAIWLLCRRQFALGRRFIRVFRWVGCFQRAWEGLVGPGEKGGGVGIAGLERMLVVGKWSTMGAFLGCESAGILDVMGVWPSKAAKDLLIEGNKFWFYSLLFSLTLGLLQLVSTSSSGPKADTSPEKKPAKAGGASRLKAKRRGIKRKLLADSCDLLVPGFVLGWIPTTSAASAAAGCVSSLIAMGDIWNGLA